MKLKCKDGKVRTFLICKMDEIYGGSCEAKCLECGEPFGWHDTRILKPMFKNHICKEEEKDG